MLGALDIALVGQVQWVPTHFQRSGDVVIRALSLEIGVPSTSSLEECEQGIATWNNAHGRDPLEVATALRNAKRWLPPRRSW